MQTLTEKLAQVQGRWGLKDEQLAALAHVDVQTWRGWLARDPDASGATVPLGMESAVPVLNIFHRLEKRFGPGKEAEVARWLSEPHVDFGGQPPLDVAASSLENLFWVSYYLDSASG
jgi:hypothetical protein